MTPEDLLNPTGVYTPHTENQLPNLSLDHVQNARWARHINYISFQRFPDTFCLIDLIPFSKSYKVVRNYYPCFIDK